MKAGRYLTVDDFSPYAKSLRKHFDRQFKEPLKSHAGRFVWDYWHVEGEYTHLRTPAFHYFPKLLYDRFHNHLVRWGRMHLGCHDISPPWLSCYVDGCRQQEHVDRPHGPLAFVFSLTPWEGRRFSGGETFLRKPTTLIPSLFNRLTLFNPSIAHGVKQVRGTHDPREGRLVIHGWFVNPRPFWVGPLSADEVGESLDKGLSAVFSRPLPLGQGLLSLRLAIARSGQVTQVVPLLNTLDGKSNVSELVERVKSVRFQKKAGPSRLTLPLICDN